MYLAAHLYRLSIEALQGISTTVGPPVALVHAMRLAQLSQAAEQAGLHTGQSCATARAICPDIILLERNPVRETTALRQLACAALRFTPDLSLIEPSSQIDRTGLILEIGRSLSLFGGARSVAQQLRTDIGRQGFSSRLCIAPTPTGAWLLAQQHDGLAVSGPERLKKTLSELPVELLDASEPHLESLHPAGLRTLGHLLQLPRAGLARRFGMALLDEIDRALGDRVDPRLRFDPPERFDTHIELASALEQSELVLHAARRLIEQLCGWLRARQSAALRLDLTLGHAGGRAASTVSLRLERPTRDADHLSLLLKEQLHRLQMPAPAQSLHLHCEWTVEHVGFADDLFPNAEQDREQLERLVERLQARLGHEQVLRIGTGSDHRPERAHLSVPLSSAGLAPRTDTRSRRSRPQRTLSPAQVSPRTAYPAQVLPRPLWLVDPPAALVERNNRPYLDGPLRLLAGPERIETGWWEQALTQRDYFIAEDSAHRMFWIFRTRLPKSDRQCREAGWFLHGRYG
jgi:protein ImuB